VQGRRTSSSRQQVGRSSAGMPFHASARRWSKFTVVCDNTLWNRSNRLSMGAGSTPAAPATPTTTTNVPTAAAFQLVGLIGSATATTMRRRGAPREAVDSSVLQRASVRCVRVWAAPGSAGAHPKERHSNGI